MRFSFQICILISLIFGACVFNEREAGNAGSSQQGNAFSGIIRLDDGSPASHATIKLIPPGFSPVHGDVLPDSLVTIADKNGEFSMDKLTPGTYSLEVSSIRSSQHLLKRAVEVAGDSMVSLTVKLAEPGTILIKLPEFVTKAGGYISIPETSIYKKISKKEFESDEVEIPSVPHGILPSIVYFSKDQLDSPQIVAQNVNVNKKSVTTIFPYYLWKYQQNIQILHAIDTKKLNVTLHHYPLLVRFNQDNFPFEKALPMGDDIRFCDPDGRKLPYEIEYWSASQKQAHIWVRLKDVQLQQKSITITTHYGKANAKNLSNGPAVWDTDADYQGVWHLNNFKRNKDSIAYTYGSTLNRNIAFLNGALLRKSNPGISGPYSYFQGPDIIRFNINKYIALTDDATQEFWFNLQSLPDSGKTYLLFLDDIRGYSLHINYKGQFILLFQKLLRKYYSAFATKESVAAGKWLHLAFITKGSQYNLFINGQPIKLYKDDLDLGSIIGIPFKIYNDIKDLFRIVEYNQNCLFDEFRISHKAHPPYWLQLNTVTQNPNSKVVIVQNP